MYLMLKSTADGQGISYLDKDEINNALVNLEKEAKERRAKIRFCSDAQTWSDSWEYTGDHEVLVLIVEGKIVVPQPVTEVVSYKL